MGLRISASSLRLAGALAAAVLLATSGIAGADALRDKWCSKVHIRFFVGGAEGDAFGTIVYGGLAVGVLDALDAMIFFGIRNGVKPIRIFQSIASGLLGRERSISGGLKSALLGVFLLGTLTVRVRENHAIAGMMAGLAVMTYVRFGTHIAFTWYVLIGTSVTFAVGYMAAKAVDVTVGPGDPTGGDGTGGSLPMTGSLSRSSCRDRSPLTTFQLSPRSSLRKSRLAAK